MATSGRSEDLSQDRANRAEIVYNLRGDGTLSKDWEGIGQNGKSGTAGPGGLTPRVAWLPERLGDSNYFLLKIPLEIHNLGHGERLTCLDSECLPEELDVTVQDFESPGKIGLAGRRSQEPWPRERTDCEVLKKTYHHMLNNGGFPSQTSITRHSGVSMAGRSGC